MASITPRDDQSDYDSSSSSITTLPGSSRSWMSNLSFGSRRSSISITSSLADPNSSLLHTSHKPHKSNQAAWQAIKRLQTAGRPVGLDHFRLLRRLGSGDLGNVYLCQIRNPVVGLPQCSYAMKVVDREALAIRNKLQRAVMEKEILSMLDHPFLPTLYAEFEASHYSCLVMEYCPGGDLYAARLRQPGKRFPVSSAKFYAAETLLALEYLHMMGIVYRDLKPENVLVREDGHIMLSDFDLCLKCEVVPKLLRLPRPAVGGHDDDDDYDDEMGGRRNTREACFTPSCATPIRPVLSCFSSRRKESSVRTIVEQVECGEKKQSNHNHNHHNHSRRVQSELVAEPVNARSKSFVGTHEYLAPEVISGQGHGSAVDWWTLGVFLYEMLYGRTPFKGENNERTLINILKQPLTFPRAAVGGGGREVEEMARVQDLISKLLVKNPKKRIGSLKGSAEIKRHEFFRGVNWALIRSVRPPEVPRDGCRNIASRMPKLMSRKEREAPYQIPAVRQHQHFDYF